MGDVLILAGLFAGFLVLQAIWRWGMESDREPEFLIFLERRARFEAELEAARERERIRTEIQRERWRQAS